MKAFYPTHPKCVAVQVKNTKPPSGFTIVELLVVMGLIAVLVSILLPAVHAVREQSRKTTCQNHLKQLAIASLSYEASHQAFPYTSTSWIMPMGSGLQINQPISPHRGLMPFLDQTIAVRLDITDSSVPIWTQTPPNYFVSQSHRFLQQFRVPVFGCPSDDVPNGGTSYRANHGISVNSLPPSATVESISQKGAFVNGRGVQLAEFRDGLSHTALFSERVIGDFVANRYDPVRDLFSDNQIFLNTPSFINHCKNDATSVPPSEFSFAGGSWLFGGLLNTWYLHILSPNSAIPDCALGTCCIDGGLGIVTARSFHANSVNVAMADGAVRTTSSQVNSSIWSALGTRNMRDHANP